jgi:hypothetical protein
MISNDHQYEFKLISIEKPRVFLSGGFWSVKLASELRMKASCPFQVAGQKYEIIKEVFVQEANLGKHWAL